MPLPPITVQFSAFQQIEILRHQIEEFEEELKKTEVRIREILHEFEKQRYLQTIHPIFQHGQIIPDSERLPELYNGRETIASALDALKQALAQLEAIAGPLPARAALPGLSAPPQRSGATRSPGVAPGAAAAAANTSNPGLRRNRFDAF